MKRQALALAKARGRPGQGAASPAAWREGLRLAGVRLDVPEGLERPVGRMLARDGLPDAVAERKGLIRLEEPVEASRFSPLPRVIYNLRLVLSECAAGLSHDHALEALVGGSVEGAAWARWIDDVASLRYRFSVEGLKVSRDTLRRWLIRVRAALSPFNILDSPSAYNCDIIASWRGEAPVLYFRPSLVADERFAYRERDVPAAINPVVAAALARLAHVPGGGVVIDPTCGSGTLLFERGFVDRDARLVGMDIDPDAIAAAGANAAIAGVASRLELLHRDCRDATAWRPCNLVLANLPFGIRSGRRDHDLAGLYRSILDAAAVSLAPGGKVVLATANRTALEGAIAGAEALSVLARHRYTSGGLHAQVVVLGLTRDDPRAMSGRRGRRPLRA